MIFLHKRSNVLYRMLFVSFDVATQRRHIVYMNMETGVIFNRDAEKFHKSFKHYSNPQDEVEPNPAQQEFVFQFSELSHAYSANEQMKSNEEERKKCLPGGIK